MPNIWGIEYEEIYADILIWELKFKNGPFKMADGNWYIGIGSKLIRVAQKQNVDRFILKLGKRDIEMSVPTEFIIKQKDKDKEYKMLPSLFPDGDDMKIYYFRLEG